MTAVAEHPGQAADRSVALRFPEAEYRNRITRTRAMLRERGQSAMLVFAQESHYYLISYETCGYVFFQVWIVTANEGPLVLLTRTPDRRQAEGALLYDDIRIWLNAEDANPALDLRAILEEPGLAGERVGIEYATYGLTAANGRMVDAALDGVVGLEDASDLVRGQRLVKSEAELDHVRRAGDLADTAVESAIGATRPGALDSTLSGAALTAMLDGGGEVPSGVPLVNSGERALFGRGIGGPRALEDRDQVLVELAASYYRYHVCIEHTLCVAPPRFAASHHDGRGDRRAGAVQGRGPPRRAAGHAGRHPPKGPGRRRLRQGALRSLRLRARLHIPANWMDVPPMIYTGNPLLLLPGMVLFVHIMIPDTETGLTAGMGQTFAISEDGAPEVFSALPLQLWRC